MPITRDAADVPLQGAPKVHTATINALNAATDDSGNTAKYMRGKFNISISGTWTGTVTVQRSFDDGVTWLTCTDYTSNIETSGDEPESGVMYRAEFTAYTSGSAVVRISQ